MHSCNMGQSQSTQTLSFGDGNLQAALVSGMHEGFAQAVLQHGMSALESYTRVNSESRVHLLAQAGNSTAIEAVVRAYTERHVAKRWVLLPA